MDERTWGASGVGKYHSFAFSEAVKRRIISKIVGRQEFDPESFITDLENSVINYMALKRMSRDSRPKAVKSNLDNTLKAAKKDAACCHKSGRNRSTAYQPR